VVEQETRLFDPARGETRSLRSKEEAHDYRYFPDPDLLPLELDLAFIDAMAADLPELPDAKRMRFMADYGLSAYDASILVAERETADFFEDSVNQGGAKRDAKAVANWLMGDIAAQANAQGVAVADVGLSAASLASLVDLIGEGVISGKIAKDLLVRLFADDRGADPRALVEAYGLRQVTDTGAIDGAVDAVIAANPDKAEQAKTKPGMLGWFVGQVMKSTGGKANPQAVSDALKKRLSV
jgi:aspartyl-tRNA(Asn)/glutamyl-tRNA(Gln) amidotransferase subunit B